MTTIQIFQKMFDWLMANKLISNQTDLAHATGLNEVSVSRILHGQVKNCKLETLWKVNTAYDNVFNPAWMRGESDVMLLADIKQQGSAQVGTVIHEQTPDCPDWVSALLAAKEETIAAKKSELTAKDETIVTLRDQLADKDRTIAAKDAHIKDIQQQLIDLRAQMAMEKGLSTGHSHSASAEPDHRPRKEV